MVHKSFSSSTAFSIIILCLSLYIVSVYSVCEGLKHFVTVSFSLHLAFYSSLKLTFWILQILNLCCRLSYM